MLNESLPVWRSLLFCPANKPKFLEKAGRRGADAIIIDLEDSVPLEEKSSARANIQKYASRVQAEGSAVCVRINRDLPNAIVDLEASVSDAVDAVVVPKTLGPDHLALIAEVIDGHEGKLTKKRGSTKLIALVEDAAGLEKLNSIARATPRLIALGIGGEDFATDLGATPTLDALYVAKMMGLHACAAAGILPLGLMGSVAEVRDEECYLQALTKSRELGFKCVTCVHPSQVALINHALRPSEDEIRHAQDIIASFEGAEARGEAVVEFGGKMIDRPVVERARGILASIDSVTNKNE